MKRNRSKQAASPESSMDSLSARIPDAQRLQFAATSNKRVTPPPPIHSDDIAVDLIATAMKAKMAFSRTKRGRRGWDSPLECSGERLAVLLAESLTKGDPVDTANYAAMLHFRGVPRQVIAEQALRALLRGSREDQAQRIKDGDELRHAVRGITAMLANDEWAEHVSRDPDAKALEAAITELHNDLAEASRILSADSGEDITDAFVAAVILAISELPDRTSPEDDPEAMICSADELRSCVANALEQLSAHIAADGIAIEHEPRNRGVLAEYPAKCPITRRDFFMVIDHPELGMVPTYGGPYDSYTIPEMEGEPDQPFHERGLFVHHYDHDRGGWVDDQSISLRIIHEDALHDFTASIFGAKEPQ